MKEARTQLKQIYIEADILQKELYQIVERNERLINGSEKLSNWLFTVATIGTLIAIFSQPWIGLVSLLIASIGVALLIYKTRANLLEIIDVNLWLACRSEALYLKCSNLEKFITDFGLNQELELSEIGDCMKVLKEIRADRKAYLSGTTTESISNYYEMRYHKSRYSAALKNKYNKHEIKQFM